MTYPIAIVGIVLTLMLSVAISMAKASDLGRLESLRDHALTHPGDPDRGRALYRRDDQTRCATCHRIGGEGGAIGPDLSVIGGKFDRPHLIESILEPSRQIVEGYRSSLILTLDGQTYSGIVEPSEQRDVVRLIDAEGRSREIPESDIEARRLDPVSLMPSGLVDALSPSEFTDLIAYLETLRPGGKPKFGSGITGPITVPSGYRVDVVATGLDGATALETLPDGRVLVCEQPGRVRVVKGDRLLEEPMLTRPVDSSWERGVIGVTVDPAFPVEPFVYVCWVARQPYPHHRVSRFVVEGDVALPETEVVLLEGDDQTTMGGNVPNGHQGGALHFGNDGCLYVGIGEQTAGAPAQRLDTFLGKILRIRPDGSIPLDNPFLDQTAGKYQAIWAYGCRNPFTFAVRATDGLMLINDVGGKFEEINPGRVGGNYGWPVVDHGPRDSETPYIGPIHWYPQASISGGDFVPEGAGTKVLPEGTYLFADFVQGWIKAIDPSRPEQAIPFATGLRRPVDLRFNDAGALYVLLRNAWVIDGKFIDGTGSLLKISHDGLVALEENGQTPDTEQIEGTVQLDTDAVDPSAGNLPAYRITTPNATYYLEKTGAGLSSLIDRDGHDWIGFEPTTGSGSAGEYRGFPNAVHKQAGNYFHPRNDATDPASTRVVQNTGDRVTIEVDSDNGLWAGRYEFRADGMTFTMTKMPADYRYWILYEGTPGGSFDGEDWWMTSAIDRPQPMRIEHRGDIPAPEWIAFGDADPQVERALLVVHHEDDEHPDRFYSMNREMTVFGFGRAGLTKFLDSTPQRFTIRLVETNDHDELSRVAEQITGDK